VELFRNTNIDWLGKKWYFLGFSLIFSVAGLLSILFWNHIPLGVDFKGGTQVKVSFPSQPSEDHLRTAMDKAGVKDFTIQRLTGGGGNQIVITLPETHTDAGHDTPRQAVVNALTNNYKDSEFKIEDAYTVGPTAGKQLQKQAILATVYSLIGMLVYLWFRFELIYGVAAVVAVFHDTLITLGAFSLANKEITLTVIAALLTLIGYSMNDTIVVFDRIRENAARFRDRRFDRVVNQSINETLSRTIWTSATVFFVTLAMNILGVGVIRDFAFAMNVGVIVGTYSSIFIASPILIWLNDKYAANQRKQQGRQARRPRTDEEPEGL